MVEKTDHLQYLKNDLSLSFFCLLFSVKNLWLKLPLISPELSNYPIILSLGNPPKYVIPRYVYAAVKYHSLSY